MSITFCVTPFICFGSGAERAKGIASPAFQAWKKQQLEEACLFDCVATVVALLLPHCLVQVASFFFVVATGNESVCQDAAHGLDSAFSRLAKAQNSFAKAHEKAWQRRATY